MSIIRDCENRKKTELKDHESLLTLEIGKHHEQKKRADNLEKELLNLQQTIQNLSSDDKIHQHEKNSLS